MRLADMLPPDEMPTKPGTPQAAARKCRHCGLVFGAHGELFPKSDAPCYGVRSNFEPEDRCDADAER